MDVKEVVETPCQTVVDPRSNVLTSGWPSTGISAAVSDAPMFCALKLQGLPSISLTRAGPSSQKQRPLHVGNSHCERRLSSVLTDWSWPFSDARHLQADGRYRGVAAVSSARLNGSNGAVQRTTATMPKREAVARPNMRFVPVKSAEQQAVLSVHRVRQGFIEQRTATINCHNRVLIWHPVSDGC